MATLEQLVGRLTRSRPGLDRSLAIDFLNERMRSALHRFPNWSGLTGRTVISIPTAYTLGSVATTTHSNLVIGSNTAWPVSDWVSTTIVTPINVAGAAWVQLASIQNIIQGTQLYVDGGSTVPEILPVLDIIPGAGRVYINPQYPHPQGAEVTVSSLASLQIRLGPFTPVFTVVAVTDTATLVIDTPWGDQSLSGQGYQIILMYTVIAPDVDSLVVVQDPVQSIKLRLNVTQDELALVDPNRQAVDSPQCMSAIGPNAGGLTLYEIYPAQTTARQLGVLYHKQWPNMRLPFDTAPPWLSDNMLVYGGLATAYATPCPRGPEGKDPGYNLDASMKYEQMFEGAYIDALTHDQSKIQSNFSWNTGQMYANDDFTEGSVYGALAGGAGGGSQPFPPSPTPPGPSPNTVSGTLVNAQVFDGTVVIAGTIGFPGLTLNSPVGVATNPALPSGVTAMAQVTAPGIVSIALWNLSGATLPSSSYTYTVALIT